MRSTCAETVPKKQFSLRSCALCSVTAQTPNLHHPFQTLVNGDGGGRRANRAVIVSWTTEGTKLGKSATSSVTPVGSEKLLEASIFAGELCLTTTLRVAVVEGHNSVFTNNDAPTLSELTQELQLPSSA